MQPISEQLSKALKSQTPRYAKKIVLRARQWDAQQNKYIFAQPRDITKFLIAAGPVKYKLDNEGYGVWNNASAGFTFSNYEGAFDAPLSGARVDIFAGAHTGAGADPNAPKEFAKVMSGYILTAPIFNERERSVTINISGEMARLQNFSAEEGISITQTREELSILPNEDRAFPTRHKAVAEVLEVRQGLVLGGSEAAKVLRPEIDYKVSGLNQPDEAAVIIPRETPPPLHVFWVTYRRWHTQKPPEWLAAQVAQLSGAQESDIEGLSVPGGVKHYFDQPSATAFSEGEHDLTQLKNNKVTLAENFLDRANFSWIYYEGQSNLNIQFGADWVTGSGMILSGRATAYAPCLWGAYGTWQLEVDTNWQNLERQFSYFISQTGRRADAGSYYMAQSRDGVHIICNIYRVGPTTTTPVKIGAAAFDCGATVNRCKFRIIRYLDGSFYAMIQPDGRADWLGPAFIATDNTYTTSGYFTVSMSMAVSAVYSISYSRLATVEPVDSAPEGAYTSPVIDSLQSATDWGEAEYEHSPGGGESRVMWRSRPETADGAPPAPWGDWQAIASGAPLPTRDRYLQLQWQGRSGLNATPPTLSNWRVWWDASAVNIAMLNLKDMSFLDTMRELARFSGFQIGYDNGGRFLFRPRRGGEPVLNLGRGDIYEAEFINDGSDYMYNRVKVNFSNFNALVDCFTQNEPRPNAIDTYGLREYAVSSGTLLPPQNADFARAIAPLIYARVSPLKKRAAISARFLPQLELGDILAVDYPGLNGHMRVEGIELDFETWRMRLDLAEV